MKHSTLTMFRRVMAMTLALLLVVGLTGCIGKGDDKPTDPPAVSDPTKAPTEAPTEKPTEAPTEAPTEPPVKGVMGTVSANNLNVRSNHASDSAILSQLPVNLRVEILEQKTVGGTNWGRIGSMTLPNGTKIDGGWLNLHYVKLDNAEAQTPTEPGTTTVDPDEEKLGTITAEQLQIRKGAGTTYDTAGSYKKGDRVKILETKTVSGTTWGRTEKGWISMTYVKLDGSAGSATDTGTNVAQPGATKPTTGSSSGTGTGTGTSTASKIEVSNGKTTIKGYVVVDTKGLTLRTGPGTKYKSLGTAVEGDRYPYYQTSDEWYRTSHGWLSNVDEEYLYIEGETADDAGIVTVKATKMNVRKGPGTNFSSVDTLKKGERLAVLGQSDDWGYTRLGWISMDDDYVDFTKKLVYTSFVGDAEVLVDDLNIRKKADADSDRVGSLDKEDDVKILEVKDNWGRIGTDKWINLSYVKMTDPAPTTPTTPATKYNVYVGALTGAVSDTSVAPNTASCTQGTTVTLLVNPGTGKKLKSITVTDANGNNIQVADKKFTMPASNVTVTAEFIDEDAVLYKVSIGTVTESCSVTVRGGTNEFTYSQDVILNVQPAAGYQLDQLKYQQGTATAVPIGKDASDNYSFKMPNGDVTITATFSKISRTVSATVSPASSGTASVDKTTATIGEKVQLTYAAADGYEFDKVTATGGVTVGSDKTFTVGNANVEVTVTFKALPTTAYKVKEAVDVKPNADGSGTTATTLAVDAPVDVYGTPGTYAKILHAGKYHYVETAKIELVSTP